MAGRPVPFASRRQNDKSMRMGMRILISAILLGASAGAALAEGPYEDRSYWAKVERWQDCAWKQQYSPYPPAFAYGPTYTCNYGPPAAQYYMPPAAPGPYQYSYPYNYYR
jgi:hypothetical protein